MFGGLIMGNDVLDNENNANNGSKEGNVPPQNTTNTPAAEPTVSSSDKGLHLKRNSGLDTGLNIPTTAKSRISSTATGRPFGGEPTNIKQFSDLRKKWNEPDSNNICVEAPWLSNVDIFPSTKIVNDI